MKYLFFDIECAGVFKNVAKICAFGYCLVDEQFHILEKEDLLINPQGHFHLTDRKGTQGLILPYTYSDFKKYPTFVQRKEKIYSLLQDSDTLVVGHAVMNDVKYLNLESKRFTLPSFRFRFADTQFVYMNRIGDFTRQFGLETIANELGVEFTPHRAVDDAYATMKIAERMCVEENCTFAQLLEKYQITSGKIENYEIEQGTSAALESYKKEKERLKEERERKRVEFHIFSDRQRRHRAKDGALKHKTVCFSHAVELQTATAKKLLSAAFAQAANCTFRADECDIYVHLLGEGGQRLQSAIERNKSVYTVQEFANLLGVEI